MIWYFDIDVCELLTEAWFVCQIDRYRGNSDVGDIMILAT